MKTLRNYTPHKVFVYDEAGKNVILEVNPEDEKVRVSEIIKEAGAINGVPVIGKQYSEVVGLPKEEENVINIVSVLVLNALKGLRNDVVCPDTGPQSVVRNESGQILGIRRFQI